MLIIENDPNYFKMVVKFIRGIKISINKSGKERMVDIILLAFGHTLSMLAFLAVSDSTKSTHRLCQIDNNNNNN